MKFEKKKKINFLVIVGYTCCRPVKLDKIYSILLFFKLKPSILSFFVIF